jgi:DNA polymerase I-like protein with 3'-5' exonuclease and polymerase domains
VSTYVFDVEADGFLDAATKIHCIVLRDVETGKVACYHEDDDVGPKHGTILEGIERLAASDGVIGHNILGYDIPLVRKLYPDAPPLPFARDTLVDCRNVWPDIKVGDYKRVRRGDMPGQLLGSHKLEAWGYRMKIRKGEYLPEDPDRFQTFDQDMLDYCVQDTKVAQALLPRIDGQTWDERALRVEPAFARILQLQEHAGFKFDEELSDDILRELQGEYADINEEAHEAYPPWKVPYPSYVKTGKPWRGKTHKDVPFNPGSRQQVARALVEHEGWVPEFKTDSGQDKLTNDMLRDMSYPKARLFAARFDLVKRMSQLDHGEQSWRNHVRDDGRIAAQIIHNGTVTARCTHRVVTSVPKKNAPYGSRMRELFTVPEGRVLVGWDASGLEARALAHYLYPYDKGRYADLVLNGDIHQATVDAIGQHLNGELLGTVRDAAKKAFYSWLYGAGNWKIGYDQGYDPGKGRDDTRSQAFRKGAQIRKALLKGIPGLDALVTDVKAAGKKNGWVRGLDGRRVAVRSEHSMLNTALQSFGGILMKWATVFFHDHLITDCYLVPFDWWMDPLDADFVQVGHWHDEVQTECKPEHAEVVAAAGPWALHKAGEFFKVRLPIDGEAKIGTRWSETH